MALKGAQVSRVRLARQVLGGRLGPLVTLDLRALAVLAALLGSLVLLVLLAHRGRPVRRERRVRLDPRARQEQPGR